MDEIIVTARYDAQKKAKPISLLWNGKTYLVEMIGRHWEESGAQFMMAMLTGSKVYLLKYVPESRKWFIQEAGSGQLAKI